MEDEFQGPVYGVKLLDCLPLNNGMLQALPRRAELKQVVEISLRTAAGYEVLISHFRDSQKRVSELEDAIRSVIDGHWTVTGLQEIIGELS